MTESASQHLRHVQELFEDALSYPEGEPREIRLQDACAGNAGLLAEVQRLLRHYSAVEPSIGHGLPTFGVYQATLIIGRGGMGVVYQAHRADGEYRRRVAIKVIAAGLATNFLHEEFRRERQILASLDHPGIARLLDGGVDDTGAPYQVMEFIDGLHLDRHCAENNLSSADRLALFHQVLDAVEYAHSLGVVHRDLKPSNILVDTNGNAKLLDFGAARLLRSGDATVTSRCFTPEYASPELMAGEPVNQQADIYSLGVLYARLLGLHARAAIVRKAKSPALGKRYSSVAQFRAALNRNDRATLRSVGAGLLVLGCLAAFYLWRTHSTASRTTMPS